MGQNLRLCVLSITAKVKLRTIVVGGPLKENSYKPKKKTSELHLK